MPTVTDFTAPGGQRENQDAYFVQQHPGLSDVWWCAVADGQGGQAGGGEAARLACATVLTGLLVTKPATLPVPSVWCDLLQAADAAVEADKVAGYTTLLAFALIGDALIGASSGDSAVLVVPRSGSPIEVTARQRKNPPIGSGAADIVPFGMRLSAPYSVLAMSDGVWKYAGWERVAEVARALRGEAVVSGLLEVVRLTGSGLLPDDFTLVLLESK